MRAWTADELVELTEVIRVVRRAVGRAPSGARADEDQGPGIDRAPSGAAIASTSWVERAACRGKPTAWWFPEPGGRFDAQVARLICGRCPVAAECLQQALLEEAETGPKAGIRGGLTVMQRRALRRSG